MRMPIEPGGELFYRGDITKQPVGRLQRAAIDLALEERLTQAPRAEIGPMDIERAAVRRDAGRQPAVRRLRRFIYACVDQSLEPGQARPHRLAHVIRGDREAALARDIGEPRYELF